MSARSWSIPLATLGLLAGCGGGGSSSDEGTGDPGPVTLTFLYIEQAPEVAVPLGDLSTLTLLGQYSDGSVSPVSGSWLAYQPTPPVLSISGTPGSALTVTGLAEGYAIVKAVSGTLFAQMTVRVTDLPPLDPGPVFSCGAADGISQLAEVLQYPADGSAPTTIHSAWYAMYTGLVLSADLTTLWLAQRSDDPAPPARLYRIDLTQSPAVVTPVPLATWPYSPDGLERDTLGRIYTQQGGVVYRYTPGDPDAQIVASAGGVDAVTLTMGPDGALYYCPLVAGPFGATGNVWILRHDLDLDVIAPWAAYPDGVGLDGFVFPSGVAINRQGETFIGELRGPKIYKYVDGDGSNDALGSGEMIDFSTLPPGVPVGGGAQANTGITFAGSGRSVLVNVQDYDGLQGLYWLADRDGNGDANGAGETALYHPTSAYRWGIDYGNFLAAPR